MSGDVFFPDGDPGPPPVGELEVAVREGEARGLGRWRYLRLV